VRILACLLAVLLAVACGSRPPAPVVERSRSDAAGALDSDGNYRVRRGDTLYAIAFRFNLDHRDIARWNGIRPPYLIYPEQVLRVVPPPAAAAGRGTSQPKAPVRAAAGKPSRRSPPSGGTADAAAGKAPAAPATGNTQPSGDPVEWLWPARGRILRGFLPGDPSRNGLDIAGREGQDVVATAGGTVVYSGSGLIGYGELIIVKHSDRMLSAYAHNRVRLVAEGAAVRAGQKIAEMGRNDRNEQLLHFEIRENGRPVNPLTYLPRR
jgi:lipoprotein NlpD